MPTVVFPCTPCATIVKTFSVLFAAIGVTLYAVPPEAACEPVGCMGAAPCETPTGIMLASNPALCVYVEPPTEMIANDMFEAGESFKEIIIPHTAVAIGSSALNGVNENAILPAELTESEAYATAMAAVPVEPLDFQAIVEAALPKFFVVSIQCVPGSGGSAFHYYSSDYTSSTTGSLAEVQSGYTDWAVSAITSWAFNAGILPEGVGQDYGIAGVFYPVFLGDDGLPVAGQIILPEAVASQLPETFNEEDLDVILKLVYAVWNAAKIGQVVVADPTSVFGYIAASV